MNMFREWLKAIGFLGWVCNVFLLTVAGLAVALMFDPEGREAIDTGTRVSMAASALIVAVMDIFTWWAVRKKLRRGNLR